MQFNNQHYMEQRDAIRAEVKAGDQAWRGDVNARFGKFLQEGVDRAAKEIAGFKKNPAMDTEAGRDYIEAQSDLLATMRRTAAAHVAGTKDVEDPVEAEITMRLYYRAALPQTA